MCFVRTLLSNKARNLANRAKRNGDDLSDIVKGGVDVNADFSTIFAIVLDTLMEASNI